MGEVFLAQDTQLERPVALKVMSAELAKDPNQRKRFRTEAKAASGLAHPHICVIYELVAGQRPFLGHTVGEMINNIVNQPPAPLGLENPVFSPVLDGIIFKCLEKEREKRYASTKELADGLRQLNAAAERAISAAAHQKTPAPGVAPAAGEPEPAALWKPAAKAGATRNAAL